MPSAPKASRGPDVDLSQLPTSPPFTAYVSNLPYELNDADIRNFFRDLKISEIRLTRDESGRLKGYGCVDFEDRESLLEALGFQDQVGLRFVICVFRCEARCRLHVLRELTYLPYLCSV